MSKQPIDRWYVSPIDMRLRAFDNTHSATESQQAEIDKYTTIETLRDHPNVKTEDDETIWDTF